MKFCLIAIVCGSLVVNQSVWSAPVVAPPSPPVFFPETAPQTPPITPEPFVPNNPIFNKPIGFGPTAAEGAEAAAAGGAGLLGVILTFIGALAVGMLVPWGQKDAPESSLSYVRTHPKKPPMGWAVVGPLTTERLRAKLNKIENTKPYVSPVTNKGFSSLQASLSNPSVNTRVAGFLSSSHRRITDAYRNEELQSSDIVFDIAGMLLIDGEAPSIVTYTENFSTRTPLSPKVFNGEVRWGKYRVAVSNGIAYDPLVGYPVRIEDFSWAAFGANFPSSTTLRSSELPEWFELYDRERPHALQSLGLGTIP